MSPISTSAPAEPIRFSMETKVSPSASPPTAVPEPRLIVTASMEAA